MCDSEGVHSIATKRGLLLLCGDGIGKSAAAIEGFQPRRCRAMAVNGELERNLRC